jgi:hypothetical protein
VQSSYNLRTGSLEFGTSVQKHDDWAKKSPSM